MAPRASIERVGRSFKRYAHFGIRPVLFAKGNCSFSDLVTLECPTKGKGWQQ
jgi:hypothetical protein